MSFSIVAKDALCSTGIKKFCCKISFLYGYLYAGKCFSADKIEMRFDSCRIRDFVSKNFFDIFSIDLEREATIVIDDVFTLDILFDAFCADGTAKISDIVYTCESCCQAFMKGVFLAAGRMTDPVKEYHLEFCGMEQARADELAGFFSLQGLPIRNYVRKGKTVLYFTNVDFIEKFLSYIGAGKALFGVLNAKMIGEERNAINRLSNFENANLSRTITASSAQIIAAKQLLRSHKMKRLSKELQETVRLRIQYPNESLSSLASLHEPPITKSGLTHRLKKIVEIAKEES